MDHAIRELWRHSDVTNEILDKLHEKRATYVDEKTRVGEIEKKLGKT